MILDFDGKKIIWNIFLIQVSGNINDNLDFEYGDGADAKYGCGATIMNEFWYFGGDNKVSIQASRLSLQRFTP